MFRKIVSSLPFSPAIVGQLSFYAKRLRKEEVTRRTALVFVALALVVQFFVVFFPPVSANASSPNDLVNGGLGGSLSNFLAAYDSNSRHLRDIINYTGITRSEIASAKRSTFLPENRLSWGLLPKFSYDQGERKHVIKDSNGKLIVTVYSRPLSLWTGENSKKDGWVGMSSSMGWFAVMNSCGNLVTEKVPPTTPETPNIIRSKSGTNASQGFVEASSVKAMPGDQISYTLTATNAGKQDQEVSLNDSLLDTLEYSELIDLGGGTLNSDSKILSWPDITLKPGETQTRTFVVRVFKLIPSTAKGASEPTSFDCLMTNTFGNSIGIKVDCPTEKIVEEVVSELPTTGPTENLIFAGIVLAVATYFYTRSKLLNKELRIIRQEVSIGTI